MFFLVFRCRSFEENPRNHCENDHVPFTPFPFAKRHAGRRDEAQLHEEKEKRVVEQQHLKVWGPNYLETLKFEITVGFSFLRGQMWFFPFNDSHWSFLGLLFCWQPLGYMDFGHWFLQWLMGSIVDPSVGLQQTMESLHPLHLFSSKEPNHFVTSRKICRAVGVVSVWKRLQPKACQGVWECKGCRVRLGRPEQTEVGVKGSNP